MSGLRAYMPQTGATAGLWEASGIGAMRRGMGEYDKTGDWSWEYYPPPYDFLAPKNSAPMPAPILYTKKTGMGGCGCGCSGNCGGAGHTHGVGDTTDDTAAAAVIPTGTTVNLGTLFSSGLDFTSWGIGEWAVAGLGAYLVISLFNDVGSAGKKVKKTLRRRSTRKTV
jgi:hypothetical protein